MKFTCARCTECCKKYWITILPREAEEISKHLKMSTEAFLEKNCVVFLQVFPVDNKDKPHYFEKEELLKIIPELSEKDIFKISYFAVLPLMALNKVEVESQKQCILLENKECVIYPVRPGQCKIFPRIGMARKKVMFDFCKGMKQHYFLTEDDVAENKEHYAKVVDYFKTIASKKFKDVWTFVPKKVVVLYQNEMLAEKEKSILEKLNL